MSEYNGGTGSDFGPGKTGPIRGLRPTKVVPNGAPGEYELHWSPVVKWFATGVLLLLVAGIAGGIVTYREVGEMKARQEANALMAIEAAKAAAESARSVAEKLDKHLDYSRDVVPTFLTREEYLRDHPGRSHR